MVVVPADVCCGDRIDAVVIPEMGDQAIGDGLVEQARLNIFEVGECLGISLPGFLRVATDDLLVTALPGHEQASSVHPRPPATRCQELACDKNNREGNVPFANGTPTGADVPQLGDRSAP